MMHAVQASGPLPMRALFLICALGACAQAAAAPGLDFDKTFHDRGEPPRVHFLANYVLQGHVHSMEVWRDGLQRLTRRTDDALETHVTKAAADTEWDMVALDLKRKIRTDIARTNLFRIGHFTDWFSQAHGLTRPIGAYALQSGKAPNGAEKPIAACRWYQLTRDQVQSHICWSQAWRLPLLITTSKGQTEWKITAVDTKPAATGVFDIHDQGFVRNNANEDIRSD
jgi:hypothetical protein